MSGYVGWAPETKKLCKHFALGVVQKYLKNRSCLACCRDRSNAARRKKQAEAPHKLRASERKWRLKNPEKVKQHTRRKDDKRQKIVFQIGQSRESLMFEQNGRCAICLNLFEHLPKKHRHVDHDHSITDGRPNVRGLLCHRCNIALGHLADDIDRLIRAADYLKAQKGRTH